MSASAKTANTKISAFIAVIELIQVIVTYSFVYK